MIGIIGAMRIEVEALKESMKGVTVETVSGVEFIRGTLRGRDVVVAQCGIGKVFAAICAQTMILQYKPTCIINTGVAGTLTPDLGILNLAISTAVVQHDMDTSAIGDPVGLISGINRVELPATKTLCDKLAEAATRMGLKHKRGVIASGDLFVNDQKKKAWIAETFGAIACEMEGAAVGHVCYVNGVDFAILRAISDNASGEADMEYPEMAAKAAKLSQALLCDVIEQL